jgi:hypothetical protein
VRGVKVEVAVKWWSYAIDAADDSIERVLAD